MISRSRITLRLVTASVAAVAIAACASQTASRPVQTGRDVAVTDEGVLRSYDVGRARISIPGAPRDTVLVALQAIYTNLGVEVTLLNPATGEIGNIKFSRVGRLGDTPLSRYVSCGMTATGVAADTYRVTMSLVSRVTADGSAHGSTVSTQLAAYAQDVGTGTGRISCSTTGGLEARLDQMLVNRFGG